MTVEANALAVHLERQIAGNPKLAYLIGPYTGTWDKLITAIAAITGETVLDVDARLKIGLKTERC